LVNIQSARGVGMSDLFDQSNVELGYHSCLLLNATILDTGWNPGTKPTHRDKVSVSVIL